MIVSFRHGFVFIKARKAAGTSIEMALVARCGPDDIVTPISPRDELARLRVGNGCRNFADPEIERRYLNLFSLEEGDPPPMAHIPKWLSDAQQFYNHMPASEVIHELGERSKGLNFVSVTRNPYSKAVSWASWKLGSKDYLSGNTAKVSRTEITRMILEGATSGALATVLNLDLCKSSTGEVVTAFLRFESLDSDLADFAKTCGLGDLGMLPTAKRMDYDRSSPPETWLGDEAVAVINAVFQEEFDFFGYPQM